MIMGGRSPSGRAVRCIFFACRGQKRMPLLSLTRHSRNLYHHHTIEAADFIKSLRKLKYTWLFRTPVNTNFSVFCYVFFKHTPSLYHSLFKGFIRWFSSINQHYHAKKNCSIWVGYRHHHL